MKKCIFLTFLIIAFIPAVGYSGKTYYVNPDAPDGGDGSYYNPWNKIAQVNGHKFSNGDDLYFKVGTRLEMTRNLTIGWDGSAGDRVIIGAYYGNKQFGLGPSRKYDRPVIRGSFYRDPKGPHVPNGDFDALIDCVRDSAGYITVQDLELRESYTAGIRFQNTSRVKGTHVKKILIRNNIVRNAGGQGIVLNHSQDGIIENNLIDGVCLRPGRNKKKPSAHSGAAILISGGNRDYLSRNNVIRGNTLRRGFEMIGIYKGPRHTTIENNTIYEFTDMGIYCANSMYGTISKNVIYNGPVVWWVPYQADDKGIQAGIQVDSEGHVTTIVKEAGGWDIFDNRIAHAKWGIMLASRSSRDGVGCVKTKVFNNRIIDSKKANIVLRKGTKDTMQDVEDTWKDNSIYENHSFIYKSAGKHVNPSTWPGVSWDGNYFNSKVDGDAASGAKINQIVLKKKAGWTNLVPGSIMTADFEFTKEITIVQPKKVSNILIISQL